MKNNIVQSTMNIKILKGIFLYSPVHRIVVKKKKWTTSLSKKNLDRLKKR